MLKPAPGGRVKRGMSRCLRLLARQAVADFRVDVGQLRVELAQAVELLLYLRALGGDVLRQGGPVGLVAGQDGNSSARRKPSACAWRISLTCARSCCV